MGGYECSTHTLRNGKRLDVIGATKHDQFAQADYRRLTDLGIRVARDGVRWHLIEFRPYCYDFSSLVPMLCAARQTGVQIIWDLLHYGWPDDLDIWSPQFVRRFQAFARACAQVIAAEGDNECAYFTPVNEISFFAWAGGEVGCLNPFSTGRGAELKRQLIRASIAAIDAIREVMPDARFVHVDPVINIVLPENASEADRLAAERHCEAQHESWDMLCGRLCPELGGHPRYLDIAGANYYVHNQWEQGGRFIGRDDPRYRPLSEMLRDLYLRYSRPVFLSETGIEDELRADWLNYVSDEVAAALWNGTPVEGICLYPIVNHPGWDDDRHCHNGLWDYCSETGEREIYAPLARELRRQTRRMAAILQSTSGGHEREAVSEPLPHLAPPEWERSIVNQG